MPIYEYKCQKCGGIYELKQSFADEPLTTHEGCGGTVERLISAPALQFKGSGWYITDYARPKGGSGNGKNSGDSKAETKSDSKAESKSDSSSSSTSSSESKGSSSSKDKK